MTRMRLSSTCTTCYVHCTLNVLYDKLCEAKIKQSLWWKYYQEKWLKKKSPKSILYSGKLSREKTFMDRWEWSFHRENVCGMVKPTIGGYGTPKFHRENFRGMAKPAIGGYGTPKFRGENFRGWLSNRKIRESFLPWKFSAIRYVTYIV